MTKPKRFQLRRIEKLAANAEVDSPDRVYQAVEFEPSPNKKYMVSIEVGDQSPSAVAAQLQRLSAQLKGFFPEGSVLVVPARNGHPVMGIYELEPADGP